LTIDVYTLTFGNGIEIVQIWFSISATGQYYKTIYKLVLEIIFQ
jgi:hypothetical protein